MPIPLLPTNWVMKFAKSGQICNFCLPNALLTFQEYLKDYGDEELKEMGKEMIDEQIQTVPSEKQRERALDFLDRIRNGERDLRF